MHDDVTGVKNKNITLEVREINNRLYFRLVSWRRTSALLT